MKTTFRHLVAILAIAPSAIAAQSLQMDAGGLDTRIGGFADASYRGFRPTGRSGFDFGGFDLFVTSKITQHISFLAETVFERDTAGVMGVDLERLSIAYSVNSYLRLAAGRFHTPLGYWNSAYHHGALMAPVIDRPNIVEFEDGNGILPMHTLGAMASGREIGPLHVGYDVSVGSQLSAGGAMSGNPTRGVTAAVSAEPIEEFKLGASVYSDRRRKGIPTQSGGTLAEPIHQLVTGGYVAWTATRFEAIGEVHQISQNSSSVGTVHSTGGYAYAGVRFGTWVPYAMYEAANVNARDLFYDPRSIHNRVLGIRAEISSRAVAKFEVRDVRLAGGTNRMEPAAQFAIAF